MTAWLVVNAFMHSKKFDEIYEWLITAAKKQEIHMEIRTNAELMAKCNLGNLKEDDLWEAGQKPDFVLFWDKDVRLARLLEKLGLSLYNSAEAIAVCDDKSLTHERLSMQGITMPKTICAPMTFSVCGYPDTSFLTYVENCLGFPMVVKECFGSFGAQVYLVHTHEELEKKTKELAGTPFIYQEWIEYSKGRDLRIQMVGEQAVACMERYSDTDFRANITNGGKMRPHMPTTEEVQLAARVMKILKLDFAGVDLLFGKDGKPVLCEVNSNAHFKNIYDCTGVNAADFMISYIKTRCVNRL